MYRLTKRLFDIAFFVLIAPIAIPTCILFGGLFALLHWESPIFRQSRIGYQNKPFLIWKLRTMTDTRNADGKLLPDADRLTLLGRFMRKFSIDELPQLINILRGDMSFVGPRPQSEEFFQAMSEQERRRHAALPGITGWAQINGRNGVTWERRFELDLWYVENRSFVLDIAIFLKTPLVILGGKNIGFSGHETMPKLVEIRNEPKRQAEAA